MSEVLSRFTMPFRLLRTSALALILAAGFAFSVAAQDMAAPTLPPPVPAPIQSDMAAESDSTALPSADGVDVRAPGLQLSPEDSFANPFVPAVDVPKTPEQIEAEIREQAFSAAATGLLPMQPSEIRRMMEKFDQTRQAIEVPIFPYPKPEIVIETVSTDPGIKPSVVKVATGHVTTLNLIDATGAPWPIEDISWGGNFEVISGGEGSNIIKISPMSDFAYGNMAIKMIELNTPISFIVETHRDKVHYRFDARIAEYGPNAAPPLIDGGMTIAAGSPVLSTILDGVPPPGAVKLDVSGVDGRTTAYMQGGSTYVRTPLTLLSPTWSSSISSADGMNVYALGSAPVLLLSDRGEVVRAKLSEKGQEQ